VARQVVDDDLAATVLTAPSEVTRQR
jgi:hypothetical protein